MTRRRTTPTGQAIGSLAAALEVTARHQLTMELTSDGWRVALVDLDELLATAPLADDDAAVAS